MDNNKEYPNSNEEYPNDTRKGIIYTHIYVIYVSERKNNRTKRTNKRNNIEYYYVTKLIDFRNHSLWRAMKVFI